MEIGVFDAVIFDFDGTLGDSHDAMMRAYARWGQEYGVPLERMGSFTGMPNRTLAEALLPAEHVDRAAARLEELEVADAEGVVALPGARAALAAVRDRRRAIATSCTRALIDVRLGATGLPRPGVIVSRSDVHHGKPAPDSFLLAARRLGAAPSQTLVCEDAPAGVRAARAAGMPVLGVLTNHTAEELAADWHVADLSGVVFDDIDAGVRVSWA